ncbi:MAG: hypothetical protein HYX75_15180 [Acidobacteria bacterium]|nr:hypothetical protein [Acidobacteriota bacterium]
MARIHDTSKSLPRVRDTSTALACIPAKKVTTTLGANRTPHLRQGAKGPISLLALAELLSQQLASTGGRPGLANAERRQKIPTLKGDWQRLKHIASQLQQRGVPCTPGQVAGILLHEDINWLEAAI